MLTGWVVVLGGLVVVAAAVVVEGALVLDLTVDVVERIVVDFVAVAGINAKLS